MKLVFRTDGSATIGLGHVMRCLALAQVAQESGHSSVFIMAPGGEKIAERLRAEQCMVLPLVSKMGSKEDAVETTRLAREQAANWIIADGYQFDTGYQQTVRKENIPLLFIDDYGHAGQYDADIILNQNFYADEMKYRNAAEHGQQLLGPMYALLRREFVLWQVRKRTIAKTATRILVSMGGADTRNDTGRVLKCLESMDRGTWEITVVSGAANPHLKLLEQAARESRHAMTLLANVSNMAALMAEADVGITAGGSTCYELLYMGLPGIVLITADNQERNVLALGRTDAVVNAGWNTKTDDRSLIALLDSVIGDQTLRSRLSAKGMGIVDGRGCSRVLSAMQRPHA
ncbi:MAG: UDP-2,4-diacetamido-2,4,6-trideoxy-beta-L-altropyranose hydrolase [Candidatus Peribacter sp.]|nr:UDP-2,4-diacetamido-2,4,6-trideoxy-beta-L-altropyranose hydrolase [Candidatus Peribacter sp.]